jgi:hypothetical protein
MKNAVTADICARRTQELFRLSASVVPNWNREARFLMLVRLRNAETLLRFGTDLAG